MSKQLARHLSLERVEAEFTPLSRIPTYNENDGNAARGSTRTEELDRTELDFPPLLRMQPVIKNDGYEAHGLSRMAESPQVAKSGTISSLFLPLLFS
jgi:hypothetical protein